MAPCCTFCKGNYGQPKTWSELFSKTTENFSRVPDLSPWNTWIHLPPGLSNIRQTKAVYMYVLALTGPSGRLFVPCRLGMPGHGGP
jgi:hypothetical protein